MKNQPTEFSEAVEAYRRLSQELGEEIIQTLSAGSDLPPKMRGILHQLAHQPSSNKDRRARMIGAIEASWRATGAHFDDRELERTIAALGSVERERFVDPSITDLAYLPLPLDIGDGQTISDPFVVACMTLAARVRPGDLVLDVGTGSGYQAAVLAALARSVVSVEIRPSLARAATARLQTLGIENVQVRVGDGSVGIHELAPFDAIVVAAGASEPPPALIAQLRPGGRLVMPLGPTNAEEQLVVITRGERGDSSSCVLGPARFVPLMGRGGRDEAAAPRKFGSSLCYGAAITRNASAGP